MLVLDEDGKSARECKVSISHDGEYASAFALVEDLNPVQRNAATVGQRAAKGPKQTRRRKNGREARKEDLIRSVAQLATSGDQMTSSDNTKGQVRLRYLPTGQTAGFVGFTQGKSPPPGEEAEVKKKSEEDLKPPDFFW